MTKKLIPESLDIIRAISAYFAKVDGELRERYPLGVEYAEAIYEIDTLTKTVIRSRNKLFSITTNRFNKTKYVEPTLGGRRFISALNKDFSMVKKCFNHHEFSPRFKLFVKHADLLSIKSWLILQHASPPDAAQNACEALNRFINSIRDEGRSSSFKAEVRRFERSAEKNELNLYRYLRKTLTSNGRINLCRYDVSYRKTGRWPDLKPLPIDQKRVKQHRDALIKFIRKEPISKYLIGYSWKMEQSAERGFQYHLLLLLEEESYQVQETINGELEKAWDSITGGNGLLVDCSMLHPSIRSVGAGLVDNSDNESWKTLRRICHYMTQADRYLKLKLPEGRTFGKAGLVKKKTTAQKQEELSHHLTIGSPVTGREINQASISD